MKLPNKVYDILKWVALVCLPTLEGFYFMIAEIWDLPYGEEIAKTITAIAFLIGGLIGVSHLSIKKEERNENN